MRFQLVPKSPTLDDLEWPYRTLLQKTCVDATQWRITISVPQQWTDPAKLHCFARCLWLFNWILTSFEFGRMLSLAIVCLICMCMCMCRPLDWWQRFSCAFSFESEFWSWTYLSNKCYRVKHYIQERWTAISEKTCWKGALADVELLLLYILVTARCYAERVMRWHVVCLSVCLSVRPWCLGTVIT